MRHYKSEKKEITLYFCATHATILFIFDLLMWVTGDYAEEVDKAFQGWTAIFGNILGGNQCALALIAESKDRVLPLLWSLHYNVFYVLKKLDTALFYLHPVRESGEGQTVSR